MKYVLSFYMLLVLVSCSTTMDVQHDKTIDLSSYKTYSFYPTIDSNLPEEETKRVLQVIALQLYKQGYEKSKTPDFYVNFFVEENSSYRPISSEEKNNYTETRKEKADTNRIYLKTIAIDQLLYLDIVDVKKDQLAWNVVIKGFIEEPITDERLFQYYSERIEKALKKFKKSAIDK
ncbi:DUF4136 domain-containing protein [Marixanthomonas ophiurae]|uniref:DUF4136 domain-containing protein n=1 Tax=Marixanthomonas ophiurae TaxID=387659 RepID=A0A3E1Q979_9FLAO|nr:DUF4136 domain-containing protein [Marixanthomonas ophiurae]RFN58691.1 DUF4136 domain-containing protein [Marixanthomonas ophiurae]